MHPAEWWRNHEVEVRTGVERDRARPGRDGASRSPTARRVEYERLVLATGATPRELPGARVIRTIERLAARSPTMLEAVEAGTWA